jgi:nucleotide-binding universal stress UspA family protein
VAKIIVSYDGTASDEDALAYGRLLAKAGASLVLAYVRHPVESAGQREGLAEKEAEQLLETGARWLAQPEVPRRVVLSASTPQGLRELAAAEAADAIVFGSEYRTAPGHVDPGTSARALLDGGPVAIGIAPSEMRYRADAPLLSIAAVTEDDDTSAAVSAQSLARHFGSSLATRYGSDVGLIVVSSNPGTTIGTVRLSAAAQYLVEMVRCPVLALARGVPIVFGT